MKILIIEDESIIARRIMRMTKAYFDSSLQIVHHCDSITSGLSYLENQPIDLLLLDLNLNGEDGFDILKHMVAQSFQTIIISAYKDSAITAFEFGVMDFVAKPFNQDRLFQAFARLHHNSKALNSNLKYLAIQKRGTQFLVNIEEIMFIQGARIYTEINLMNGSKEIHNKSLDSLLSLLPDTFERIHKSYIANMNMASAIQIESGGKYTLKLKHHAQVPISRGKYKDLKDKWFG